MPKIELAERLKRGNRRFGLQLFARGFLLTRKKPEFVPKQWERVTLHAGFDLWHDPRARVVRSERATAQVVVLGDAFSLEEPQRSSEDICARLAEALVRSRPDFLNELDTLHGRFAVIFRADDEALGIVGDATGMRAIFHPRSGGMVGSHAALVAANAEPRASRIPYARFGLPGRRTTIDEIVVLPPNQEITVESGKLTRIWPRARVPTRTTETAAKSAYEAMQLALKGIVARYPALLVSLTAGIDSRATLAACLDLGIANQLRCFTYYRSREDFVTDKVVAERIAARFSLEHDVIDLNAVPRPPKGFSRLCEHNAYYQHSRKVANACTQRYSSSERVHLRSNIAEIGRDFYRADRQNAPLRSEAEMAATYIRWSRHEFGEQERAAIIDDFRDFFRATSFQSSEGYLDPYDQFYWEHRMGTWHSQILLETDTAFQTLCLFNSRPFLEAMLSVPIEDRADCTSMRRLIELAYPQCLLEPFNPRQRSLWQRVKRTAGARLSGSGLTRLLARGSPGSKQPR